MDEFPIQSGDDVVRVRQHVPGEGGDLLGPEARFDGQQQDHAVPKGVARLLQEGLKVRSLAAGESLALGSGARGRLSNPGRGEASPKVDSLEARHCFQSAELLAQPCEFFAGAFAGHGLLSP